MPRTSPAFHHLHDGCEAVGCARSRGAYKVFLRQQAVVAAHHHVQDALLLEQQGSATVTKGEWRSEYVRVCSSLSSVYFSLAVFLYRVTPLFLFFFVSFFLSCRFLSLFL